MRYDYRDYEMIENLKHNIRITNVHTFSNKSTSKTRVILETPKFQWLIDAADVCLNTPANCTTRATLTTTIRIFRLALQIYIDNRVYCAEI